MTWKVAGINFDHFHMGDLLRLVHDSPDAELVGICDEQPDRMRKAISNFGIPAERVFTDYRQCMEISRPDLVILCPAAAEHAVWTQRIAPYSVHILIEKPMAASLAEADEMIHAVASTGKQLAINWPLRWYPSHATAYRLVSEGRIGEVMEVHYYDGNRGPLWHLADKVEHEPTVQEKAASWFYKKLRGGGSLLDYLGYGTTLATWYLKNKVPTHVSCMQGGACGLEVDEQSVTIAKYGEALSTFHTRWGTFTDPWTAQPQPKCGFILKGKEGTISSYDFEPQLRLQTRQSPTGTIISADTLTYPDNNPVDYFLRRLDDEQPIDGPLSPRVSRIGQQIVDTAIRSLETGRAEALVAG